MKLPAIEGPAHVHVHKPDFFAAEAVQGGKILTFSTGNKLTH
jgi:hypothetical protein